MENKNILYLGSQSPPRQKLIANAGIKYKVLRHDSDECVAGTGLSFEEYVLAIAKEKMEHLILPDELKDGKAVFVLTADTLVKSSKTNQILGKPKDEEDILRMHKLLCEEVAIVVTGCCIEKKVFKDDTWQVVDKRYLTAKTIVEFCVDEESSDLYLEKVPNVMNVSGAATIEGFGQNFLKSVDGSYSSVLGLPIYEVRKALEELGF